MSHTIWLLRIKDGFEVWKIWQKNSEKFVWVRHPFERILSAFHNKLEHPFTDEFQLRYGRKIVKNFRPYASEESLEHGDDVSITEFIKYLVNTGKYLSIMAYSGRSKLRTS